MALCEFVHNDNIYERFCFYELSNLDVAISLGSFCYFKWANNIVVVLNSLIKQRCLENQVKLRGSFCMGMCPSEEVSIKIADDMFSVNPNEIAEFFETKIKRWLES